MSDSAPNIAATADEGEALVKNLRVRLFAVCLACLSPALANGQAQAPAAAPQNPSPALVGRLTKQLSVTPEQATGGAGAIFGLAKSRLAPDQFGKISAVVPGMDGLLGAAPKPDTASPLGAVNALGGAVPAGAGPVAGLAPLAGSFKQLGLSPDMAAKFVPIMTRFIQAKGGTGVSSLFTDALK
jgi:hypothetical protein